MADRVMRLTVIRIRKPAEKDVNKDLQWFSESFGLFGERDKEKSCFRVFLELIKAARRKTALNSDEIALRANLTRATVIHHLNRLIESGIVIHHENRYLLRTNNLEELIDEIKKDTLRLFEDIKVMAEELDEELGLTKRKNLRKGTISD